MKTLHSLLFAFTLLVGSSSVATAQDFDKGVHAFKMGDFQAAVQEWRSLAEQGNIDAQRNMGLMYAAGKGVPQNYVEAAKWYRLAAKQGNARAQFELGVQYRAGLGVLQDYDKALEWYRLAAEQGNADAQNQLGNMYGSGTGVPQNFVVSHMWYSISAANGKKIAASLRDKTSAVLSSEEVYEAQRMARECMSSNYQNCGQ